MLESKRMNWEELAAGLPSVTIDNTAAAINKCIKISKDELDSWVIVRKKYKQGSSEYLLAFRNENYLKGKIQGYKEALVLLNTLKLVMDGD